MFLLYAVLFAVAATVGGTRLAVPPADLPVGARPEVARHDVDHVIVGIDDIERGLEQFRQLTGVSPVLGGVHPGAGTQNALVSLGEHTYLEIMAPAADAPQSVRDRFARFSTLTLTGWAASTTDAEASEQMLRASGYSVRGPSDGARVMPNGIVLRWRTLSATVPGATRAPFLIEWNPTSRHPATSSPAGCRLRALSIREPAPSSLDALVRLLGLTVSIQEGEPGMRIELSCLKRTVVIGG
jgi:hypothetical protein